MNRRTVGTLLTAVVVFGALGAGDAGAFGPRRAAIVPYYGYAGPLGAPYLAPAYGYYYNPYVAPFPAYGIMPPPFATIRMVYGDEYDRRGSGVNQLDYTPRMRATEYPA